MGKQRKKKGSRLLSEQKNQRRSLAAPKKNPFEQRKLKKKFEVVGQRLKPQEGAGQARSQALEHRKKTLLVEYQQRENVNAFIDKRIGEKDESLSHEEKMLIRYQKEKQRKLLKKSLFSLDDQEESLTHLGQSLSELDAFDDYMGSDDEEEVDSEIVSDYHFGGGIFQKVDQAEGRTREEIMKEVIAKSKYFKQLHQREREESIALTEELDDDLGDLLPLLSDHWKKNNEPSPRTDEFDVLTREFANEARARPLNRLATPEEIAKKQRDRLELLEKERIKRMKGESSEEEEEEEQDDEAVEEEEGEEKLGPESDDEDQMSDKKASFGRNKKGGKKFVYQAKPLTDKEMKLIDDSLKEGSIPFLINVPNSFEELQLLLDGKTALEIRIVIARILASNNANLGPSYKEHLQRMFELSLQYFEWRVNVHGGNSDNDEQTQILDVLSQAFYTLLPSITATAVTHIKERLIQMHLALDESLHINAMDSDESPLAIWKPSDFFLFKVLSNLFPVTDYQHPIITPTMVLMNRYIVYVPVRSLAQIISKLYLSSMILHYATPAKRFVPEVLSYLQLVLLGCLSQKKHSLFTSATKKMIPLLQLRKGSKREKKIISQYQMAPLNLCRILQADNEAPGDILKYQAVFSCVTLIGQFAALYEDYECYIELFTPFSNLLTALYGKALPPQVQELVLAINTQIVDKITSELNDRRPLTFPNLKPMPIRSLAPDFIENYIPGRDYDRNQERARHRALKKIVKAEKKGAMRELRKDNIFLENERMKKRIADDDERKEKYNQIMHQLELDQHQYNVSDKMAAKAK